MENEDLMIEIKLSTKLNKPLDSRRDSDMMLYYWHDAKKVLPAGECSVIGYDNERIGECFMVSEIKWLWECSGEQANITHWMPFPKPPGKR